MKVRFLCTGNSCRGEMAEGWARHLKGDLLEPYSDGEEKLAVYRRVRDKIRRFVRTLPGALTVDRCAKSAGAPTSKP